MEVVKIPQILKDLETSVDCKVILEPKYRLAGCILFPDGRRFYFKNTSLDINSFGAAEIARDKGYTRFFMQRLGVTIPKGDVFFSDFWCKFNNSKNDIESAILFAQTIGFPLIVKPNNKSHGEDVYKIYSDKQLKRVLLRLFKKHNIILLEEFIQGEDFRIVVLDGEAPIAYRRSPLKILGDGTNSIQQLFEHKSLELTSLGRSLSLNTHDPRIKERLRFFYKINLNYILEEGREITLLDNANLSTGGDIVDVSSIIHDSYKMEAIKLSKAMGLRFAGIDLITSSRIDQPGGVFTFIETNSSPGLSHFASLNFECKKRVENLYFQILLKLKNVL